MYSTRNGITKRNTAGGYHWEYVNEPPKIKTTYPKKVKCIETGIIYNSITECAKEMKLNPSHITACCKGKRKTTGNKHFKYI